MKYLTRSWLVLVLCVGLTACSLHTVRPGALDRIDSNAFNILGTAAITLEAVKADCPSGPTSPCPQSKKDAINKVIEAYNAARASWLGYRDVVKAGKEGNKAALLGLLSQLQSSIGGLK